MTPQPARPVTREALLLWVIQAFSEHFRDHAVLKGGMALRLLDSERLTNDVDFVLVPFESKRDVLGDVRQILRQLDGADVGVSVHSTMIRADVSLDGTSVQVECSVAMECRSVPMATASLAAAVGQPSRIVRIMDPSVALAHKLAAWNERRLARDLYDAFFLFARARALPDLTTLDGRLARVRSRRPELRRIRQMSRETFAHELNEALSSFDDARVDAELGGLLPETERAGLALRIRTALNRLVEEL